MQQPEKKVMYRVTYCERGRNNEVDEGGQRTTLGKTGTAPIGCFELDSGYKILYTV